MFNKSLLHESIVSTLQDKEEAEDHKVWLIASMLQSKVANEIGI